MPGVRSEEEAVRDGKLGKPLQPEGASAKSGGPVGPPQGIFGAAVQEVRPMTAWEVGGRQRLEPRSI